MPPSPVMRVSPRRELKAENHKRGHSLEGGALFRHKEDNLALFNEVRDKERDDFLLQSNDNFDDFFSTKLRGLCVNKLGGSTPVEGESSDLLKADRDKNDYDWLITPPETPLFRSLDDEVQPVKPAPRGRPGSQPVSVSQSPTMEKDYTSGRGSVIPHCPSPSPWSGNSTLQSRSRPVSATCSSPSSTTRHSSPARRSSPSPTKPTSAPRSSTPTPRRISIGSTGTSAPSRVRGSSPVKTSRGNSASPKIRAWQTNIPGFSLEAPPNLCTSLADRPAPYVRSASPTSRYSRQSMSPAAARSVVSSHSHDQDPFSPYRKGSVASSGDDDADLLQSIPLSSSEQSAPRNLGAHPSNNATSLSRKQMKKLSSSAPKRSFDLVRQMDRNGPHNMFRPMFSSVPSSTFHAGKMNAQQRSLTSRNSSMKTSSNASCDQAKSGPHHDTVTCSKCGHVFHSAEVIMEGDQQLCLECKCLVLPSTITDPSNIVTIGQNNTRDEIQSIEHESQEVLDQSASTSVCLHLTRTGLTVKSHLDSQNSYSGSGSSQSLSVEVFEEGEPTLANEKVMEQPINGHKHYEVNSSSRLNVSDGTGISLLLRRSSSVERHIVQTRSFTASTTSYDNFSYVLDSLNNMRSSTGRTNASVSSSIDMGSSRQTDFRHSWQSSSHKSDTENCRYEITSKLKRSISPVSSASGHVFQVRSATPSCHEDGLEETRVVPREQSLASEFTEGENTCSDIESNIDSKAVVELSSRLIDDHSGETRVDSVTTSQVPATHEKREKSYVQLLASNQVDDADMVDATEVRNPSSLNAISENEIENDDSYYGSHSEVNSPSSKGCSGVHDARVVLEESRILLEDKGQAKSKALTQEEAADAILFCSSIIHNLVYEAANFAIDKEALPVETLRPAVTLVGKSNFDRGDAYLRICRSQKARKQGFKTEMEITLSSCNAEADERSSPCTIGISDDGDTTKPRKLESKCNCLIM